MPGRAFTVKVGGDDAPFYSWVVAPATDYVDLSGNWKANMEESGSPKHLLLKLLPYKGAETCAGVFEISGDRFGELIISSENQVHGFLTRASGLAAPFTGSFNPATATLQLEVAGDNADGFRAIAVRTATTSVLAGP